MKRSHKIITAIVLIGILLASGILPDHGYYAQFRTIELCSEAESVEERAVNPLNTHAVQRVKFRGVVPSKVADLSLAFHSVFIHEVAKAVLPDIPRFIRFCSLLN